MGVAAILRGHGREPGRQTLALRGLVALLTVAAVVAVLVMVGRGAFADDAGAVVLVDDAGGSLVPGADVKYDGVIIGEVSELRAAPPAQSAEVEIAVTINEVAAADLPGNLLARVLPASIFGTSFVDLVTDGRPRGEFLSGQSIPQDRSRATLEIQDVLDDLDRVVKALGPAELAGALEGLAGALDGNGERLGRTIEVLERYLSRLNPSMGLVRQNLELLATNLEAFERYAPDLFSATEDVLVAARTLAAHQDDFGALARDGSRALGDTADLLSGNEEALVEALVQTAVVVDVLYDGRERVVDGLLSTIELARRMRKALAHGPWARIDGNLVRDLGEAYGPEDCPVYHGLRGRGC